ncbi:MAG: VanZ family protein [Bacteroidaceae bacterium]|nr:VanZ family protein [Bacteroidaceae bacterium]
MRNYLNAYKTSSLAYVLIFIASMVPVPDYEPLRRFDLADKWAHIVMYGVLSLCVWWDIYHVRRTLDFDYKDLKRTTFYPIIFGGIMEIVQRYCTFGVRNGDWLDFIANTIGVALGFIIGFFVLRKLYA